MRPRFLIAVAGMLAPAIAGAQDIERAAGRCEILDFPNFPDTRIFLSRNPTTGETNTFAGGGVFAKCRAKPITIRGDSLESYGNQDIHYLIGNVRYREPKISLDAERLTYYQAEERLVAEINVRVVMEDGSVMTGPRVEYFRAAPPIRDVARLDATHNPQFDIITRDSVTNEPTTTRLLSDHVSAFGDSTFYAGGDVRITRTDVNARADSATVNKVTEFARLIGRPIVEGTGERSFTLRGRVIDMFSEQQRLRRVLSKDSASVVSRDVNLVADTIDLRIQNDRLQRAFAWGATRARATSPGRDIFADSIDVQMPNQKINEVWAIGQAYAETMPDTTRLVTQERDWIRGDTIVARFDTAATGDTSTASRARELVANGTASSFYQVPTGRERTDRPAINYVRGRIITAALSQGQVQTVTVVDSAAGMYLEPATDSSAAAQPAGRNRARRGAQPTPPRPGSGTIRRPGGDE